MLSTTEGQIILGEFISEFYRSGDPAKAYESAVLIAQQRGTLPALQIGLTLDFLTFLKLLLPVLMDKWKEITKEPKKHS